MYIRTLAGLGQVSQLTDNDLTRIIQANIRQGIRDENTLTDQAFFARHPERGGRKLVPGEPQFAQLSSEWLSIRDRLVRPLLASTSIQPSYIQPAPTSGSAAQLAARILKNPRITLATVHSSGNKDHATARQNIVDTARRLPASRSSYGNAPGGTVPLDIRLLDGILRLARKYSFDISEIAGGSHSETSRHYVGVAVDVNYINGIHVGATHPDFLSFMQACRSLGATEVLGPGDKGHSTHIHAGWPRP